MRSYSNKRRTFVGAVILFLLCSIMVGCSSGERKSANSSGFTDFEHIEQEYLDSLKELNWPEGTVLPTELTGEDADQYQIGYGNTRASMLWECAWQKAVSYTHLTLPTNSRV